MFYNLFLFKVLPYNVLQFKLLLTLNLILFKLLFSIFFFTTTVQYFCVNTPFQSPSVLILLFNPLLCLNSFFSILICSISSSFISTFHVTICIFNLFLCNNLNLFLGKHLNLFLGNNLNIFLCKNLNLFLGNNLNIFLCKNLRHLYHLLDWAHWAFSHLLGWAHCARQRPLCIPQQSHHDSSQSCRPHAQ